MKVKVWLGKNVCFSPNKTKGTIKTTTKVCTHTFTFHLDLCSLMSLKVRPIHLPGSPTSSRWASPLILVLLEPVFCTPPATTTASASFTTYSPYTWWGYTMPMVTIYYKYNVPVNTCLPRNCANIMVYEEILLYNLICRCLNLPILRSRGGVLRKKKKNTHTIKQNRSPVK